MVKDQEMNTNEMRVNSEYLNLLKDRINLHQILSRERGSRLLIFHANGQLTFRLAERWFKRAGDLISYRHRPPLIDQWIFEDENGNPPTAASMFGWSSAVFIDLAIQAARERSQ
jgi:hypothetical protein